MLLACIIKQELINVSLHCILVEYAPLVSASPSETGISVLVLKVERKERTNTFDALIDNTHLHTTADDSSYLERERRQITHKTFGTRLL